jgi:hypothetical protein
MLSRAMKALSVTVDRLTNNLRCESKSAKAEIGNELLLPRHFAFRYFTCQAQNYKLR